MTQSLVAFDTDRIKSYVFATDKLAEIRGASTLLDHLNREQMPALIEGKKVFANGGSGLFVVPSTQAESAIRKVQGRYRDLTEDATVTGVKLDLPADFDEDSDLRPYWQRLSLKLRAAKDQNKPQATLMTHPFVKTCDSCGLFYAIKRYTDPDQRPVLLCMSCLAKRHQDRRTKNDIQELMTGRPQFNPHRLWHRLVGELQRTGNLSNLERPPDFNQLGNQSSPEGYLGLVYADGDSMGSYLEEILSLTEMKRFATGVDQAVYGALQSTILEHLQPKPDDEWLPFDVLLLGGDDLVMVTTAQTAVQAALTIMEQFADLTESSCGHRLSMSVAVVLAHVKFPFRSLLDLAESVLKFAKKEKAKRKLVTEGLLNFLVVSSANHLDFSDYYRATLRSEENDQILCRTMRPYTVHEMQTLIQARSDLSDAPRGKLEQLRSAVFKSRYQATFESQLALLRWRNEMQRQRVKKLISDFAPEPLGVSGFPWVQRDDALYTPLLDLVELFDFIS